MSVVIPTLVHPKNDCFTNKECKLWLEALLLLQGNHSLLGCSGICWYLKEYQFGELAKQIVSHTLDRAYTFTLLNGNQKNGYYGIPGEMTESRIQLVSHLIDVLECHLCRIQ